MEKNKKNNQRNDVIEIKLDDGSKTDANILFTFEENGDQFILYEINGVAYGAKIKDDNSLIAINDDEWELVEKIFNEWSEEQQDDEEND